MSLLFSPLRLRELEFKNRIFVSPMCQFSALEGLPNHWHMVHLGSRAVGGAALILVEATAISPEGRISSGDLGIWNEDQKEAFKDITSFIKSQNCIPGIQLAHAGRKASAKHPWSKDIELNQSWAPLAPSSIPFDSNSQIPQEITTEDLKKILQDFIKATERSLQAGFEVIELHMAHGYLLNEFLSPLSNHRQDQYGGSLENRMRFPLEIASAVRNIIPSHLPLFVRISATEWMENGWTLDDSLVFCEKLKNLGVDFIDCSTGGNSAEAKIPVAPNYQITFAENIKHKVHIATGAVGLITGATQAEAILKENKADAILIGRELLRDPYWPLHAAHSLGVQAPWPLAYNRAKPHLL